jgi:CelD/BcsL family acetyltransferase involved in cellulose biosynthesis
VTLDGEVGFMTCADCLAPPAGRTCVLVTDPAQAERLRPAWDELLTRSASNELTLTPDWLLTWWRVYGPLQGRQLRLALFHDAGRLVGLAPLLARRHWYAPGIPFRRLEFLGSGEREEHGICSPYLNVLAERGAEDAVARALAAAVATGALGRWDEVVLPTMAGDGPMPELLVTAFRRVGLSAASEVTGGSPYVPLPATWDAYLQALPNSHRRLLLRSLRAFEEHSGGDWCVERVAERADLEKGKGILLALHRARWQQAGLPGVFGSPHFLRFHDEAMSWLLAQGGLELLWLSVRGEPVAAVYAMVRAGKVYFYQTGRKPDLPGQVRPGAVLIAHALRSAIEAGRREFDLLSGVSRYKLEMALAVRPLVRVRVVRACLAERLRRLAEWGRSGVRLVRRALKRQGSGAACLAATFRERGERAP